MSREKIHNSVKHIQFSLVNGDADCRSTAGARRRCEGQQELSFASTFIVEIGAFTARYSIGLLTTRRGAPDFFLIASHPERVERTRIMPNTIQIHRVLRAAPERVYRAFLNPEAMAKWL